MFNGTLAIVKGLLGWSNTEKEITSTGLAQAKPGVRGTNFQYYSRAPQFRPLLPPMAGSQSIIFIFGIASLFARRSVLRASTASIVVSGAIGVAVVVAPYTL